MKTSLKTVNNFCPHDEAFLRPPDGRQVFVKPWRFNQTMKFIDDYNVIILDLRYKKDRDSMPDFFDQ